MNRQFILLTTEQATAPLLNAKFSTSRGTLKQFLETNRAQLFALTARDAVAGELVNLVYSVENPAKLFGIRKIKIDGDTTSGTVATAKNLGSMIDRFKSEEGTCFDDVLIGQMIGLAKETGDVTRNPVSLKQMKFAQDNFWTSHFGGLYVFRGGEHPAVIGSKDHDALVDLPIKFVFDLTERSAIAKFLKLNDMVEPIAKARGLDAAAILHQKMDFVVASVAAQMGEDLAGTVRRDLRNLGRRYAEKLPEAWQGRAAFARWAEADGPWPRITSNHDAYFYTLRAKHHADSDLVNMLLAELCPLDIHQLFICHKEAFYAAYATWPDEKRAYVVDLLDLEYQADKAGMREAFFGHDALLEEPKPAKRDIIQSAGPWGAVWRR